MFNCNWYSNFTTNHFLLVCNLGRKENHIYLKLTSLSYSHSDVAEASPLYGQRYFTSSVIHEATPLPPPQFPLKDKAKVTGQQFLWICFRIHEIWSWKKGNKVRTISKYWKVEVGTPSFRDCWRSLKHWLIDADHKEKKLNKQLGRVAKWGLLIRSLSVWIRKRFGHKH